MANIIALVWDCDRTLINGYMQDPMFKKYGIEPNDFWGRVHNEIENYEKQGFRVNHDTYYLNYFIKASKSGEFKGLNNGILREFGKEQNLYPGVQEFFEMTKNMFEDKKEYEEYGIQVEHYIISTGFAEVVRGMTVADYAEDIWGCELSEAPDENGNAVLDSILFTVDNTAKTKALFEINKGTGKLEKVDVNSKIPPELRRVQFENMIYIADGPSDIPAFSVMKQMGGSTFAIYPKGNLEALKQVEQMRFDGRVDMYAEADYREGTTANMWIKNKIQEIADRIRKEEKDAILSHVSDTPKHLD